MAVELRRSKELLEFKWHVGKDEVVFLVKPESSEDDRMSVAFAPVGGDRCRELVRRMVVGWKGVQREGAEAPFAFSELEFFPRTTGKNLFLELGRFILDKTDITKESKEVKGLKND